MIKIKNRAILIIAAGSTVKKYWDKIEKFIEENNPITIGCNNIMQLIKPDIHFWGSSKRWKKFWHLVDKDSKLMFPHYFPKKTIEKRWKNKYGMFGCEPRGWKFGSEDKNSHAYKRCRMTVKKGKMRGCFGDIATKAIFWSYMNGSSMIYLVGNDGYSLYLKEDYKNGIESQHCYGDGFTDGFTYDYGRRRDWLKYKTLRELSSYGKKKYGFSFEIITPTIYEDFYNYDILKIKKEPNCQKWIEPSTDKERKYLYEGCRRNRIISKEQWYKYNG
jgi:hypothetical protein